MSDFKLVTVSASPNRWAFGPGKGWVPET